ncbi:hypothetical protein [Aliarcobacter cryaerophilus]|uniref:hypothetical protein n=1 Tax=Aliarcobacter cryaerophilus TaxID=28198 RepID=UPI003DA279B9
MLDREFVEKTINEHKKVYKKRLALLFSKVYDLIEKTERSEEKISLEIGSFGYFITIKDYSSLFDDNSLNNTFYPEAYKRLKDWHCWDEKEFIQKLDESIVICQHFIGQKKINLTNHF